MIEKTVSVHDDRAAGTNQKSKTNAFSALNY
jgi:hypothetical protein